MKKEFFIISTLFILLSFLFFSPLFYPEPQLFVTPDFGTSDIWYLNYPLKNFLSESLKRGELPLWSKEIGMGFPALAEGQIGTFHPLNLILFGLLPTWLAFNLSFVFIFALAGLGMYLFLRKLNIGKYSSFIGGFLFAFSGYNIVQISHINLLLAINHLPWVFLALQNLLTKQNIKSIIFLAFVLTVQFFSGFPQITFITIVASFFYLLYYYCITKNKRNAVKILILFVSSLVMSGLLGAVQLLPNLEFTQASLRRGGLNFIDATNFPYPLKHLLSFVNPFLFGTPQNGTYPRFSQNWGIFWENTSYIGLLSFIFTFMTIVVKKTRRKVTVWVVLIFFSLLIILGKNSPIYFIFSFPPFSLFRVPSRFLLVLTFALIVISTYGYDFFERWLRTRLPKTIYLSVLFFISIVTVGNIYFVWKDYHPLGTVKEWLSEPEISRHLKRATSEIRISTFPFATEWNKTFLTTGWQQTIPYREFHENLAANLNMLFHIPSNFAAGSFLPRRLFIVRNIESAQIIDIGDSIEIGTASANVLNLSAITHILSPKPIQNYAFTQGFKKDLSTTSVYLYQNRDVLPRFRFATNVIPVSTVSEFLGVISTDSASLSNTVLLENQPTRTGQNPKYFIDVKEDKNTEIKVKLNADQGGYFVIADSYYPGWVAIVDGEKRPMIPANINQRAVLVEKGEHNLTLRYDPVSLKTGFIITLLTTIGLTIYLAVFPRFLKSRSSSPHNV